MTEYLLIAFIVLIVIAPLMWLKTTPGQARASAFRARARKLGLRVQLVPEAGAPDSELRPATTRYLLPFDPSRPPPEPGSWVLMRSQRRGWQSPWQGWRWVRREAPDTEYSAIENALAHLPESVTALARDREGFSAYWSESGDIGNVDRIEEALRLLRA